MSWFDKLVPPRIKSRRGRNGSACPRGCGRNARPAGIPQRRDREPERLPQVRAPHPPRARASAWAFLDPSPREEIGANVAPLDLLKFKDTKKYKDRLSDSRASTGESDALVAIVGALKGVPLVACAFEFGFMGGSMGSVVGERFVRAANVSNAKFRSCASPPAAARACRKGCFRLCRWPRPAPCSRASASAAFRISRC